MTAEGNCSTALTKRGLSPLHQRTVHRQWVNRKKTKFTVPGAWWRNDTEHREDSMSSQRGFLCGVKPAQTCREISAPQLDRARNVQFRHFPIDREL